MGDTTRSTPTSRSSTSPLADLHAVVDGIEADFEAAYPPRAPSSERFAGSKLSLTITGIPNEYFNCVTRARFDSLEADTRITKTLERFAAAGVDMSWWVGPSSTPADLGERLEAQGLMYQEHFPGMAADLHVLNEEPTAPDGMGVKEVAGAGDLGTVRSDLCAGDGLR